MPLFKRNAFNNIRELDVNLTRISPGIHSYSALLEWIHLESEPLYNYPDPDPAPAPAPAAPAPVGTNPFASITIASSSEA